MEKTRLNILPVPTFSSLGVNYAEREMQQYETEAIRITESQEAPVRVDVTDSSAFEINASEGRALFVIQYIKSDSKLSVDTSIAASAGARVKLVQVFERLPEAVSKLKVTLADSASFELVQLVIGGGDNVIEDAVILDGARGAFTAELADSLAGSDRLDLNLIAEHRGRKTTSEIHLGTVLSGTASKIFKGTIDFKNGASGAKGSEQEEALLLGNCVRNRTVPVILCSEEDVEGSHGATVGRLDEKHIFYLRSRGICEEKIYELMARSKLMRAVSKIEDEPTKARIYKALGWGDDNE
ncbi:MAG: SufD family Fe-S cluster assembly protein [Ruminococcus sp.]|nr:SufD family Fe-S cluster assembly protein [Ruminococcus sp.]